MSDQAWRVDEPEQESPSSASPSSALVTMHFLVTALRRRWRVWVGLGCLGMILGLLWVVSSPPKTVASVSLVLAHEPSADPQQALSTDVSLLQTRTLAADVIDRLDLDMSPEQFQQSVVSVPASTDVLVLEVSGPDDATAVERAEALADAYLAFRASQINAQAEARTRGYRERVSALRDEARDLSAEYGEISTSSPRDDQETAALLNEQAQVATEIESRQDAIDDATLQAESVIDASFVLDPARPKPESAARAAILALASGLIGGIAVGVGYVLVTALASNRLRLREEIALALDAPVRISVPGRARAWWPFGRTRLSATSLAMLVDTLDREVSRPPRTWLTSGADTTAGIGDETRRRSRQVRPAGGRDVASRDGADPPQTTAPSSSTHLALAALGTEDVGRVVMAGLAARLSAEGLTVFVVDMTEAGGLAAALVDALDEQEGRPSSGRPVVYRPDRLPCLERGPLDWPMTGAVDRGSAVSWPDGWDRADVTLTLADLDPAVGVEHLRSWADEVVVLVAAGGSSAELLRTTGELIRSADLRLLFAMLVGADHADETLGLPETAYRVWPPLARQSS